MKRCLTSLYSLLYAVLAFGAPALLAAQTPAPLRPPSLDDLNALESFSRPNRWSVARDGALAVTRYRANRTKLSWRDEAGDVWVQEAPGRPFVNVTHGVADGSEWQSPVWSPDGARLLVQSTRGGTRTLWLWQRATNRLQQLSRRDLGGDDAFYDWVDPRRVLCLVLPEGRYPKQGWGDTTRQLANAGWAKYVAGKEPSASVLESGLPDSVVRRFAALTNEPRQLLLIDVTSRKSTLLADTYPRSAFTKHLLSPGGSFIALGRRGAPVGHSMEEEAVGSLAIDVFALDGRELEFDRPLPADVLWQSARWSPDGKTLAFFAYGASRARPPRLVRIQVQERHIEERELDGLDAGRPLGGRKFARLEWTETGEVVFQATRKAMEETGSADTVRRDWWLVPRSGGAARALTAGLPVIPEFVRLWQAGPLVGVADGELWRLEATRRTVRNLTARWAARITTIAWPTSTNAILREFGRDYIIDREERAASGDVIVAARDSANGGAGNREDTYYRIDLTTGAAAPLQKPDPAATLARLDPGMQTALWTATDSSGTALWRTTVPGGSAELIGKLNSWLATLELARDTVITYTSLNGEPLQGVLQLPLGYVPGRRYPLITIVYPGQQPVSSPTWYRRDDLDRHLYAGAGYAVLWPTMPGSCCTPRRPGERYDVYWDVAEGVLPAVEQAVASGIADSARLFVEGHSMGGFATLALVTQTHRFKAAIAWAGIANWTSGWGTFSATGRYGEDISKLMIGWLGENVQPRPARVAPWDDPAFYQRNSPITYAGKVRTPVMLVHGDMDLAVPMSQSEEFFSALQHRGQRAMFVRYWGEGHGVDSPANVRDLWQRRFAWYDEHGDIRRDAGGRLIFEGNRVKSRQGAPQLRPEDFAEFDPFLR